MVDWYWDTSMCFKWLLYICYVIPISQIYLPQNVRSYIWILFVFLKNDLSPDYSDCWSWNWNLEKATQKKVIKSLSNKTVTYELSYMSAEVFFWEIFRNRNSSYSFLPWTVSSPWIVSSSSSEETIQVFITLGKS